METEFTSLLKHLGHSVTKTRLAVFRSLAQTQPTTMRQLITTLPEVDRATIYRAIDLFVQLNVAKKVYTGFKYQVELGDRFQAHHHHLSCLGCSAILDVDTPEIEQAIDQTARANGFRPIRHDLEIAGYCSRCA